MRCHLDRPIRLLEYQAGATETAGLGIPLRQKPDKIMTPYCEWLSKFAFALDIQILPLPSRVVAVMREG